MAARTIGSVQNGRKPDCNDPNAGRQEGAVVSLNGIQSHRNPRSAGERNNAGRTSPACAPVDTVQVTSPRAEVVPEPGVTAPEMDASVLRLNIPLPV